MTRIALRAAQVACVVLLMAIGNLSAQEDDKNLLRALLQRANGGIAELEREKVYHVSEKIELKSLCPQGVTLKGNGATIKALPDFRHGALLTSTELLRDDPYDPGVQIRDLKIDGAGHVGRCVFGNWKNARIHNLLVEGGTIYQLNALWHDSTLSNLRVIGNASQTNNGFDCSLRDSQIWNASVNMRGNRTESAFWLNGCKNATIVNLFLTDGRTAFGLENCKDVNVLNMRVRGAFTFRVVNILPAEASERIHLYDLDLDVEHIGNDPSAGVHFNATKGGMVARGRIQGAEPNVMLSNDASNVDIIDMQFSSSAVHPSSDWTKTAHKNVWSSRRREKPGPPSNRPPVVYAGPDRRVQKSQNVLLAAAVADEGSRKDLEVKWTKVRGPGRVVFRKRDTPKTRVSFSETGTYALRLMANDGEFEVTDEATIHVLAEGGRR